MMKSAQNFHRGDDMPVTVSEAQSRLIELIQRAHAGEEILIAPEGAGALMVRLKPIPLPDGRIPVFNENGLIS